MPHKTGPLSPPSRRCLSSYFNDAYGGIADLLEADLLMRVPGEHVSTDAMFRLCGRTSDVNAKAIVFAMGEAHHVCRWFVVPADSDDALLPGLRRWSQQLLNQSYFDKHKQKFVNALHAIKHWHDDRCCRGGDPIEHPYREPFIGLERAPYKDGFHGCDVIVRTVQNHNLKGIVAKRFGSIIRKPVEADVAEVVKYLQTRPLRPITSSEEARAEALLNYGAHIRTVGQPPAVLAEALIAQGEVFEAARVAWAEQDSEKRQTTDLPAFRASGRADHKPSSFETVQNVAACALKGCLSDCRPFAENYIEVSTGPKTGLVSRIKKSESTKNEALHRLLNRIVEGRSVISSGLLQKLLMLQIFRINRDRDARLRIPGSEDHLPLWLLKEMRSRSAPIASVPLISEPQGFDYLDQLMASSVSRTGPLGTSNTAGPTPASQFKKPAQAFISTDRDTPVDTPVDHVGAFPSEDELHPWASPAGASVNASSIVGVLAPIVPGTSLATGATNKEPKSATTKKRLNKTGSSARRKKSKAPTPSEVKSKVPSSDVDKRIFMDCWAVAKARGGTAEAVNRYVAESYSRLFLESFTVNGAAASPSAPITAAEVKKYLTTATKKGLERSMELTIPRSLQGARSEVAHSGTHPSMKSAFDGSAATAEGDLFAVGPVAGSGEIIHGLARSSSSSKLPHSHSSASSNPSSVEHTAESSEGKHSFI